MANTRKPKAAPTLREALDQMSARTAVHDLPFGPRYAEAKARFREADQYNAVALMGGSDDLKKSAQKARDEAKADYESQVYRVEMQSIPPAEFVALRTEFPLAEDRELFLEPLSHHLLERCVTNGDLSADEWAAMLGSEKFNMGDANDLCVSVVNLNARSSSADVPKE